MMDGLGDWVVDDEDYAGYEGESSDSGSNSRELGPGSVAYADLEGMLEALSLLKKCGWLAFLDHPWTKRELNLYDICKGWGSPANQEAIREKVLLLLYSTTETLKKPRQLNRAICCLCNNPRNISTIHFPIFGKKSYVGVDCGTLASAIIAFRNVANRCIESPSSPETIHRDMHMAMFNVLQAHESKGKRKNK